MKNICTRLLLPKIKTPIKTNRAMKLTCALLLTASMGVFATGNAQTMRVNIQADNVSTEKILSEIEKQTDYLFVYNKKEVDLKRKTSVNAVNKTTAEVLSTIFNGTDIIYAIEGENIMLMRKEQNLAVVSDAVQQDNKITGTVLDPTGMPVIGANIMVKGTTNGTITDMDGKFSLDVPKGATLVVTYVGFANQEISVGNQTTLSITLKEDSEALDELVVVGYMAQKKVSLTGAIASMKVDDQVNSLPVTAAGNILVGKLAGVDVSTPQGIPGSNPSVSIRTSSSWNNQDVTFVIDGIISTTADFNNLSPNEIETITALKDAASAAIYGSRSAGGVILVTTKRGKIGKPKFNYSYGYSIETRTKNMDLTDASQTAELYMRISGDSDPAGWRWSKDEVDYFKTVNDGWGYDQLKEVWRNPITKTHNLSVHGGGENIKYFTSASFVNQEGFLQSLDYEKFNFRMNVTANLTNDLELFTGFSLVNAHTSSTVGISDALYAQLRVWQPDQPVYTENGAYIDYGWIANVGAYVNGDAGYHKNNNLKPQLIMKATYKVPFIKGLNMSISYSKNWSYDIYKGYYKNYDMAVMSRSGTNGRIISTRDSDILYYKKSSWTSKDYIERESIWGTGQQLNFQLMYDHIFKDIHHFSGTLVTEWAENSSANVYGGRENFPVYLTDQFWAASDARADTWGGGDADWLEGRMSYIGQFNYSYRNKYLLNFSFRRDGSMKFAPDHRWGFFPAGSAGWVISEEAFFNKKYIQFLKIRGSVGLTGNDSVGGWQWQESYISGSSSFFGKNPLKKAGLTYGNIVNPALTWEKTMTYDLGVDMNFIDHWNLTFDYWSSNTYDILGNRQKTLPTTFSRSMPAENYGRIRSQGFDFQLGYQREGDFSYFGNLTLSYGWNKVLKKDFAENAQWIDIPVGKSTSYIIGYEYDGIIRTQEELDSFIKEHPNYLHNGLKPELGMMVFKDLSGPQGEPDGLIDNWDRILLKAKNFPVVYGLNLGVSWKGINLNMMLSGKLGIDKSYMSVARGTPGGVEWNRMWSKWYTDSWTPENTNASLPKRIGYFSPNTYLTDCSYWYKNASFMRLKYLTLSYDLPKKVFCNKFFDNVRFFITGTNLFVWSRFNSNYFDPELADGNAFPIMRSINLGIDVKF